MNQDHKLKRIKYECLLPLLKILVLLCSSKHGYKLKGGNIYEY